MLWQSKLQTETALSTMEAEIIALAACMRVLIPIMDMVSLLAVAAGIPARVVNMRESVHGDNLGALVLAKMLPPQFTPRSKYYATKTISLAVSSADTLVSSCYPFSQEHIGVES